MSLPFEIMHSYQETGEEFLCGFVWILHSKLLDKFGCILGIQDQCLSQNMIDTCVSALSTLIFDVTCFKGYMRMLSDFSEHCLITILII